MSEPKPPDQIPGEDLTPFKRAYSRALTFVCERHYPMLPWQEGDDLFFGAGIGPAANCCATDVLVARVKELEALLAVSRQPAGH